MGDFLGQRFPRRWSIHKDLCNDKPNEIKLILHCSAYLGHPSTQLVTSDFPTHLHLFTREVLIQAQLELIKIKRTRSLLVTALALMLLPTRSSAQNANDGFSPSVNSYIEALIVQPDVSHALSDHPLATNETSYPVLIYSHGGTRFRRDNTDKALELASHGYVVVAMDHMDAVASVFPSGQVVFGTDPIDLNNRIKDILFVSDELSRLNTDDALFAGRLERLGAFGYSWGGVPVAEFCRIDARCKAVVLLDAGCALEAATDLIRLGLQKPFLSMNSTMLQHPCTQFSGNWLYASLVLFTNAINHAFWCQIQDSGHQSFCDRGSLISDPTLTIDPTPVSRKQSRTIRACTLFFDKYLKNQDDRLLDNPAPIHPNIINFRRK